MSFWSVGVAIERIYTFSQAKKQSKMYAPLVAKHLKDGRLKEAIALSSAKEYRYSHLAKVVLAGLQEYQFQQETGANSLARRPPRHRPPFDSARDRAHLERPEEGHHRAGDHRRDGTVRRTARHGRRRHRRVRRHRVDGLGRYRRRLRRYCRSARRDRARPLRRHPGRVVLQLPVDPSRVLQRRDGQLVVGNGRLLHQEDGVRVAQAGLTPGRS